MDRVSPETRSENMRRIKSNKSAPEMRVRRLCHAMGYRYRLHRKDLPGKPDLVFPSRRAVLFVHGCFWHQHDASDCKRTNRPKSNSAYWQGKLARNVERDAKNTATLIDAGWRVLVIWECETVNREGIRARVTDFLGPPGNGMPQNALPFPAKQF
ncbi:DNA mismatch endonuclease Vsr [Loktanella sp. IMCC34160]|uniref:very short patch repair endonuclease n=1 Tax=Loktanella sp. IMCC34160 TaxID=2510646 RepID=UPI00101BE04D|nr:very short patch repair endonuclease [Loktanella sp. IMCC34160]RYG89827.1 DNA mismatch endonuclease Vsr [Loktanella sp. IMCC34160]